METKIEEKKTLVARRNPPGDKWIPNDNPTLILESLTDCLEYIFQKTGNTKFYMDASEGTVSIVEDETIEIPTEPPKHWSLYGEN